MSSPILRSKNLLKRLLLSKLPSPFPSIPSQITHPINTNHKFIPNSPSHKSPYYYNTKQFSTIVPKNPNQSSSSSPPEKSPSPLSSSASNISSSFDFVPRSAREKRLSRIWWFLVALNFGIAGYLFTKPKKKDAASVPEKHSAEPESGLIQPR